MAAAAAAGTDPKAGRRSIVVDKEVVPNLSLRLVMHEIRNRPKTDSSSWQKHYRNV